MEEECAIRAEPLGQDRRYNRYWRFTAAGVPAGEDPGSGRIWVEGADGGWRLLTRPKQLEELRAALEPKGLREGGLHAALQRIQDDLVSHMPGGEDGVERRGWLSRGV